MHSVQLRFSFPWGAGVAHRTIAFQLPVGAGAALHAVAFQLPVRAPFPSRRVSCPTVSRRFHVRPRATIESSQPLTTAVSAASESSERLGSRSTTRQRGARRVAHPHREGNDLMMRCCFFHFRRISSHSFIDLSLRRQPTYNMFARCVSITKVVPLTRVFGKRPAPQRRPITMASATASLHQGQIKVAHILMPTEKIAELDALYEQIVSERSTLAELASKHSTCPSAQNGGVIGWIGKGQTVAPFEDTVFSTPIGSVARYVFPNHHTSASAIAHTRPAKGRLLP